MGNYDCIEKMHFMLLTFYYALSSLLLGYDFPNVNLARFQA